MVFDGENIGCFPFTKKFAKFPLGIFVGEERVPFVTSPIGGSWGRPGHFKDRNNGKKAQGICKWNTNFHRENGTTSSEILFILENFQWNKPNSRVLFTSQPEFPEFFGKWKTSIAIIW